MLSKLSSLSNISCQIWIILRDFEEMYRAKKSGAAIDSLKELLQKNSFNVEIEKEEVKLLSNMV
jgi:hypothetical protein